MFFSHVTSFRNPMCVKSPVALSDTLTPALYGNMLRLSTVPKPTSPRNNVGILTHDPQHSPENLEVTDRAGRQGNFPSEL